MMRIDRAIESMQVKGWVRLEEIRRTSKELVLLFGVFKGRSGRRVDAWRIECSEVQEARITEWDGGGIAVYPSKHPAARQYLARQAEVQWTTSTDENEPSLVGALYEAHMDVVDDWIDFNEYSSVQSKTKNIRTCQGPEFLMRAYAKAIRFVGKHPKIVLGRRPEIARKLRVLHFGSSHVVAAGFLAKQSEHMPD